MLLSVVISGSEVCKDSFRLCAHTSLVPRASKGLWMTLGKCKKFQSRRTGRVNILSKMIFFFWCFLIQLPALQFFFCEPPCELLQSCSQAIPHTALVFWSGKPGSVGHHGEMCRQVASCLCCLQGKGPYTNSASYLGGKRAARKSP